MAKGLKKVKYKGKVYVYPRDYKEEYKNRTRKQKHNRTIRRKARSKMRSRHGEEAIKGKDIDHIKGIKAGNGYGNLRILSKSRNRARKWK